LLKDKRTVVLFLLACALCASPWIASYPKEAWDGPRGMAALAGTSFLAGLIGGLLSPAPAAVWAAAAWLGPCLVIVCDLIRKREAGLFFPLGMIALAFFAAPSLLGAALGRLLRPVTKP
jgi:hypothetical protein